MKMIKSEEFILKTDEEELLSIFERILNRINESRRKNKEEEAVILDSEKGEAVKDLIISEKKYSVIEITKEEREILRKDILDRYDNGVLGQGINW